MTQPLRKNRDFILLQSGQVLSTIGSESTVIAYPLLVLAMTHSPAKAGIVGFARVAPWGVFGLVAGLAVDRFPRKRMMIVSDVVRACTLASIVVAVAVGHLTFAQVAAVAFLEGSMYVFFNIAEIGALRSVVAREQLPTAAAAEQARYSTVTIVAPPLGGSLFGIGRAFPFLAGAIFEGIVLAFIVIARRHGLSGAQIGLLITSFGLCSLAGSALSPRLQKLLGMRAIVVGSYWIQLLVAAYVVYPSPYVLLGAFLPSAFFAPTLNAVIIGYRVAVTPDHLTGRVNSVARTIAVFGAPFGSLAAGFLLASFSARTTMAVFTIMLVLLTAFATLSPSIRDAPSLDELKPVEPMEPAFPELVG